MSQAVSRVDVRIGLHGEGDAAKVVGEVRKGLDGLDTAAGKSGAGLGGLAGSFEEVGKVGTQTTQRAGAALSGLNAVLGGVAPEIAKMGQGFTAAGAAANLIPGPIGLTVAAVTAAGLGAYELNKHLNETAAKVEALGNSQTRGLADSLHVSVDEAIKLQQALEDVPSKLRPSTALLDIVRQRAESMGKDGAAAMTKFTEALGKGPDALRDFEREFGRLSAVSADLPDVGARLGLSREALGIAVAVANEGERAKKAAQEAIAADRERQALLSQADVLAKQAADATVVKGIELRSQVTALQSQANIYGELAQKATDEANALQQVANAQRDATDAAAQRARVAQVIGAEIGAMEAQGAAQLSKEAQLRFAIHTSGLRLKEVERQTLEIKADFRKGLISENEMRIQIAGVATQGYNAAAKEQALGRQAAADLQARRQKGQQASDAEAAAKLRLLKIDAQIADGSVLTLGRVHALKLAAIDAEERAELTKDARTATTAAGHEANKMAIRREFSEKRKALALAEQDAIDKTADEGTKVVEAQMARSKQIAAETTAAVASAAKARTTSMAGALRALGLDEQADLIELRQAHDDYAAQVKAINDKLLAERNKFSAEDEDYKQLELQRLAALAEAKQRYDDQEEAAERRKLDRKRTAAAHAIEQSVAGPAALLRGMGSESAKVADALSGVAAGSAVVARNWGEWGKAAPGAISAVGAVATAFVDSEKEKAGVMAVMEAAAAIAAVAVEDYAGAAAHGAAAVLYGGIATGAIGTSSAGSAGGGAGGFGDSASTGGSGAQSQGQGATTVININTPLVSRQDVAKGISSSLRSLKTTGYAQSKGA